MVMVAVLHYAAAASEILAFLLVLREHRRRSYRPRHTRPGCSLRRGGRHR
jgi:hypothetical protein